GLVRAVAGTFSGAVVALLSGLRVRRPERIRHRESHRVHHALHRRLDHPFPLLYSVHYAAADAAEPAADHAVPANAGAVRILLRLRASVRLVVPGPPPEHDSC